MTDEKVDAFMPLWIGAYLADTMKFTTLQHGAYMLLLMAYWRDRAPLLDDDEELRGITKTDRGDWKKLRPVLERKFKVGDGVWWHKRVEAELADAMQRKSKATSKAKAAAEARWGKGAEQSTGNASSDAPSIPQAVHKECPTSTPTPPLSEGSEPKGSAGAGAPPADESKSDPETRRQLWADSGAWLVANKLTVGDAKAFMNTVAKEFPAVVADTMAEAMQTAAPVDPKAWVLGIAKRLAGDRIKSVTVPSDAADKTAELLRQQSQREATKPPAALVALVRRQSQGEAA